MFRSSALLGYDCIRSTPLHNLAVPMQHSVAMSLFFIAVVAVVAVVPTL